MWKQSGLRLTFQHFLTIISCEQVEIIVKQNPQLIINILFFPSASNVRSTGLLHSCYSLTVSLPVDLFTRLWLLALTSSLSFDHYQDFQSLSVSSTSILPAPSLIPSHLGFFQCCKYIRFLLIFPIALEFFRLPIFLVFHNSLCRSFFSPIFSDNS